ncbi:MAG: 4Fe-4S binding protein [Candidatus Thermoplasmatota archaeon]|nr:4Fe-4S binding protein [Candidatus Thermoplasmatota archaeon]
MSSIPSWDEIGCIRCVACVGSCPVGSIRFSNNRIIFLGETCTGCGLCVRICPVGALSRKGDDDE